MRRDWESWICDPEFAKIAGFRVQFLERVFPVVLTLAVLVSLFAVGALMVSALLTIPSVLVRSRRVVSAGSVFLSVAVGGVGLVLALAFDWPVGSAIVVLGLCLVIGKAVVLRTFRHS
jgi:ABC-type Mn2+/Zn2+ transport system permease subunit